MSDIVIVGIIAAAGGLLTTVLGWLLDHQGVSRQSKVFAALKSRIELVDKLSQTKSSIPELADEIDKLMISEARAVMAEIKSVSGLERAGTAPNKTTINRWKRAILSYEQISLRGRIYKGLFYTFTFFAIAVTTAGLSVAENEEWIFSILGGAIYMFIGLAFRSAAIRTYDADKAKAASTYDGKGRP